MSEDKLSIVVPVHNAEEFLGNCIESIVSQVYRNIEVILVDDGSTDKSAIICDKWAEKDCRIKVIHKTCGGVSSARNIGIEIATGKYITFVDSDDWIDKNVYLLSIQALNKSDADVVIFGVRKIDENRKVIEVIKPYNEIIERVNIEKNVYKLMKANLFGYMWNKIYKRDVLLKSKVKNNMLLSDREDLLFNLEIIPFLNKMVTIDMIGYYYLQREQSLLHTIDINKLESIYVFCDCIAKIKMTDSKEKNKIYNYCVKHYISDCIIKNLLWNKDIEKKHKKQMMNEIFSNRSISLNLGQYKEEPLYLKALHKSFVKRDCRYFYSYFCLSKIKYNLLNFFKVGKR